MTNVSSPLREVIRYSLFLSIVALMVAPSVRAQTFVNTVLDMSAPTPTAETVKDLTPTLDTKLSELADLEGEKFEEACEKVVPALVNKFMPTLWRSELSACFWLQPGLDSLRTARLSGTSEQGLASVELLSDIFWGLRVKVQSSVAASEGGDDESQEDRAKRNLQQLLASGGNLSVGATYPWFAHQSGSNKVRSLFTSFVRVGSVIPALGQDDESNTVEGDDINGNLELGILEAETRIDSFKGSIKFVAYGRTGLIHGTKRFHESILNEDEDVFAYGEIGVGFRLSDLVWILGSWSDYSSDSLPGGQFAITVGMGK